MNEVLELPVLTLKDGTPPCKDFDHDCSAVGRPERCARMGFASAEEAFMNCWLYQPSRGYCVMLVNP